MLAVHSRNSDAGNEYQRRPTRFSSSFESSQSTSNSTTSQQQQQDVQYKLKCSTTTRVSPKSRLRPPVASLAISGGSQNNTGASEQPLANCVSPTSISKVAPTARLRPTSLALKSRQISSSTSKLNGGGRVGASILPRISCSSRSSQESNKSKITAAVNNNDEPQGGGAAAAAGRLKSCSLQPGRQIMRRPNASAKQGSVTSSSVASQSSELRLDGFKNLVAVVHPQHSQRVNLNLAASKVNKLAIMKSTITTKSKIESGKLGSSSFNHKRDALNGGNRSSSTAPKLGERRTRSRSGEGKQDGGQIVARHSNIKVAATGTTLNAAAAAMSNNASITAVSASQMTSSPHDSYSSSSCSMTATGRPVDVESDQFMLSNNNNNNNNDNPTNYLLSVTSNNGDLHKDKDKKQQHGNNKQSNKHLSANSYSSAAAAPALDQRTGCCENTNRFANANDYHECYNSKHDSAKSTSPTESQTLTSNSSRRSTSNLSHAINIDHLLPKPMGQQVLSLMMLDVGLLPATNANNNLYHDQQQQQILSPKRRRRSHVRLQSPARDDNIGASGGFNFRLPDNGQSFINHDRNLTDRLNIFIDSDDQRLSNNFHSWQPPPITTATAHEMLGLQVRPANQDNEKLRSISLPSSPRIALPKSNQAIRNDKLENAQGQNFLRQGNPNRQTHHRLGHDNFCTKATFNLSSNIGSTTSRQQTLSLGEHLICDNQDYNSLTSSSSSSLNHCPPLLALANQLNVLKFEELVKKANIKSMKSNKQQQKDSYLCEANIKQPTENQNIADSTTTATTSLSYNQAARIAKQHKQSSVTDDSNTEKHHSNKKIDHAEECSQQFGGRSNITNPVDYFTDQAIKNTNHTVNYQHYHSTNQCTNSQVRPSISVFNDEKSCIDHQLSESHICGFNKKSSATDEKESSSCRRQQQPRSHSISGQEFHSNGGYQRLKQSLYNSQQQHHNRQQGTFDGYQSHLTQPTSSRIQQIPSPYQQHQLVGRSPSPLSSINCQTQYGSPLREGSIKHYPLDPIAANRQPRNQLHASLECLNTAYSDYHQIQRAQEQQLHLLQQQQQQIQQNQHYAASYVLAAPPVNTIINSNGDEDLAAAAMGTPPSQCNPIHNSGSSHLNMGSYSHQTQNLINRAMAQVSQSPLRRLGLNNLQGTSSGLLSHTTTNSSHHPMRAGHSSLSLASSSFLIEDKLQNEIRKLQSELKSEKEKNEALNSQLNINSSLMAAFEQSLTTLNTRLRQLTTLNEKKDNEIEELREQLRLSKVSDLRKNDSSSSPKDEIQQTDDDNEDWTASSEINNNSERSMMIKVIEDLKRQLIEKDRLLTDTRLEALSAAHQLEQLESKLNGEHSILINEDELDEGVMVVNHSPSDSDAITDSAHFSEINSQISKSNHQSNGDNRSFNNTSNINSNSKNNDSNFLCSSTEHQNNTDDHQSNHSSDYDSEVRVKDSQQISSSVSQQFNETDSGVMCKLVDNLLLTN